MNSIEQIREELLIASDEDAEALRAYLELEEQSRKSEELLNQRLVGKVGRIPDYCI